VERVKFLKAAVAPPKPLVLGGSGGGQEPASSAGKLGSKRSFPRQVLTSEGWGLVGSITSREQNHQLSPALPSGNLSRHGGDGVVIPDIARSKRICPAWCHVVLTWFRALWAGRIIFNKGLTAAVLGLLVFFYP